MKLGSAWGMFLALVLITPVRADVRSQAAREAAEYLLRKVGKEGAKEGVEVLARKIEALAARHGPEAVVAVRKAGPEAIRLVEQAGPHGGRVVKLLARHGEDAIWVAAQPRRLALFVRHGDEAAHALMRHPRIAEPLIEGFERPAVRALNAVNSQNARRLAMLHEEGGLTKLGRSRELLEVVGRFGDRAMEFIWKHKGALAVTAVLTAFLAEPEPFLDGSRKLAEGVVDRAVRPIAEAPGKVAEEAARRTDWTRVAIVGLCLLVVLVALHMRWPRLRAKA